MNKSALCLVTLFMCIAPAASCVVVAAPRPAPSCTRSRFGSDDSLPAALPTQAPFAELPDTPPNPPQTAPGSALGRPASLHPGAPEGFWIWFNPQKNLWHIRTTTANRLHHFQGRIRAATGQIGQILDAQGTRDEFGDRIHIAPRAVSFDFNTQGGIDGLDIQTNAQCLHFNLLVDNNPQPSRIFLGSRGVNPPYGNFLLCNN